METISTHTVAFVTFTAADVRGNSQDQRPELAAAACIEI